MLIWVGKNMLSQNDNGTTSDDKRPLPWSDEIDDDAVEADETDVEDETHVDSET